jgi:hypothetical protein
VAVFRLIYPERADWIPGDCEILRIPASQALRNDFLVTTHTSSTFDKALLR